MLKSLHRSFECITLAKEINKLKHITMTNYLRFNRHEEMEGFTRDEILDLVRNPKLKSIENKFLRGGFSVGVGGGMEGVTEVAQEVTEVGFKNAFNEVKNVFREDDKEFFTKEQTELDKDNLLPIACSCSFLNSFKAIVSWSFFFKSFNAF